MDKKHWEVVPFKDHPTHDSIWSLIRGADGHIYIGLCEEHTGGGVAQLYRYNVQLRRLEHLLDMAKVTGEPAKNGHATQGKIHFSLCAASDGSIYGATHASTPPLGHKCWNAYGAWHDPCVSFIGSHVFRYTPKTNAVIDFGVIFPNEGIPFMVLDEGRGRFYGVTYPKAHFFRMNLVGREIIDYGRVSSWYPIGLTFDSKMNIFTSDTNSWLIKYDVTQDRLFFLRKAPYAEWWNRSKRFSWISNMNMAEDGMIYGTHYSNDHIFRFDPNAGELEFEDLGPGVPERPSSHLRCLIPDGHGHVYYQAIGKGGSLQDQGQLFVRYSIATGEKKIIALLMHNDYPLGSWIGVTDLDDNMYMKGGGQPMTLVIYRPKA